MAAMSGSSRGPTRCGKGLIHDCDRRRVHYRCDGETTVLALIQDYDNV